MPGWAAGWKRPHLEPQRAAIAFLWVRQRCIHTFREVTNRLTLARPLVLQDGGVWGKLWGRLMVSLSSLRTRTLNASAGLLRVICAHHCT